MSSVIFQVQSFIIVSLLLYGVYHRKNKFKHMRIMKTAILWDLLLVAQIELTRSAIEKASQIVENTQILNIHVSLAVSTVVLYSIVWTLGHKLSKGNENIRKYHKIIGAVALTTRISTLITSFLI
jgi:hypothetical protein